MNSKAMQQPDGGSRYLKRHHYLDGALALIEENGLEKLSIRGLANHLGVSQMALYKHFKNKDALLSAALDEFILRADVIPDTSLDWEEWVFTIGKRMYNALYSDSAWITQLGRFSVGPTGLAVTSAFIDKLSDAGFTEHEALLGYFSMIHAVIGAVTLQTAFDDATTQAIASGNFKSLKNSVQQAFTDNALPAQIDISLPMVVEALKASRR